MFYLKFKDCAFKEAYRSMVKGDLSEEALLSIRELTIVRGNRSGFPINWKSMSFLFKPKISNLFFNIEESTNNQWEQDIHIFSHIETLRIEVPTNDLTFLRNFKNLRELYIEVSSNTDWSFIPALTNLQSLYLDRCKFQDISPIKVLYNKQELKGGTNSGEIGKLSQIALVNCEIKDLTPLEEVQTLSELDLSHNQISDISSLSKIKQLYYLTLNHNRIKDISVFREISKDVPLYYIDLRHNLIRDCSSIRKSEWLHLCKVFIDDEPMTDLKVIRKRCLKNTSPYNLNYSLFVNRTSKKGMGD